MFSTDFFNLLSICFPFFTLEKFFLLLVSSLLHNTCFSNTHVPYVLNDNCHWHLNVLQDMLLVLHLELGSFCISINSTHTQHPSYNVQWAFLLIFFLFLLRFLHFGILIPTVLEINGRHQTFPDQTSEMSSQFYKFLWQSACAQTWPRFCLQDLDTRSLVPKMHSK